MVLSRMFCIAACWALIGAGSVSAEQLTIGFEAVEGYTPSTSIDGQPAVGAKWRVNKPAFDQEVSNAAGSAHSGTQGFRWSNRYFDTVVQAIASPILTVPAGETGASANGGTTSAPAGSNHFAQDFWFRSVSTSTDPGLNGSISADDGTGLRMNFFRIRENAGNLEAVYQGYDVGTGTFPEYPVASGLVWGTWYHVHIDTDFVDGPGNDVVRVYLGTSLALGAGDLKVTANSWEDFYGVGQKVAVNSVLIRLRDDPGTGNLPLGIYMDDFTFLSGATASVPPLPVPTFGHLELALLTLLIAACGLLGLRRRWG
jgi:hypothetical protein